MHKGCTGYRQTQISVQRTDDGHNIPLPAEELQAFDSHWEKEREFSSSPVTDCGDGTKPFIGLTSAEAFHGAVLLNQWCFSPCFPVFCWSWSLCRMGHSTHQQSCFSTVTPSPTSRWKAQKIVPEKTECTPAQCLEGRSVGTSRLTVSDLFKGLQSKMA